MFRVSCANKPLRRNCQRIARYQPYPTAMPQRLEMMTSTPSSDSPQQTIQAVHSRAKIAAPNFSSRLGVLIIANLRRSKGHGMTRPPAASVRGITEILREDYPNL